MSDEFVAYVDKDLKDLVPTFLENRQQDVEKMLAALQNWDYAEVRKIGHQIKGSGGGYGFDAISEYGRNIQAAAEAQDADECEGWINGLADYLSKVQVVYQ